MDTDQLGIFDLIMLKQVKNINWVSGPSGRPASPQGIWQVLAIADDVKYDKVVLATKDETVIRVPVADIRRISKYDLEKVKNDIKQVRTLDDLKKRRDKDGK